MTLRHERWLGRSVIGAALAALGLAGYSYFAPPSGPDLRVAQTEIEVLEATSGEKRLVMVHLENRSGRPMRVVGVARASC
jgi:hypothetical protein